MERLLKDKKILIGITGGIAAYKIPSLIRLLVREGCQVKVVATDEALQFVTPLTLSVVSQTPLLREPYNKTSGEWTSHIDLGCWADLFLIAPLTANTMAKMVTGQADNLLLATYLAARCPVFIAPSMDVDMYQHVATQNNLDQLRQRGLHVIEAREGELASGLLGMGRMEEPEGILEQIRFFFAGNKPFHGKNILITSGPTIEPIDPVRYISNHSSGKMGLALAMEAAHRGAQVTFVSGPVKEYPIHPDIKLVKVTTAAEMYAAAIEHFPQSDITIMAAAVADFTPTHPADEKIKKSDNPLTINLQHTKDILAEAGRLKQTGQVLIGFALETENEVENANKKLHTKNLDFIVLNSLKDKGAGFGGDTNQVTILSKEGASKQFPLMSKSLLASQIWDYLS